jgi:hypothetical protein
MDQERSGRGDRPVQEGARRLLWAASVVDQANTTGSNSDGPGGGYGQIPGCARKGLWGYSGVDRVRPRVVQGVQVGPAHASLVQGSTVGVQWRHLAPRPRTVVQPVQGRPAWTGIR